MPYTPRNQTFQAQLTLQHFRTADRGTRRLINSVRQFKGKLDHQAAKANPPQRQYKFKDGSILHANGKRPDDWRWDAPREVWASRTRM